MTKSINQIDKELQLIVAAHYNLNDYYFDDFLYAYAENKIQHTTLIAMVYQVNAAKNSDDIVLTLTVCDKVYPDLRNAKDVRSDTYRTIRNLVDIIYSSKRWNSFSSVKGTSSATYFRQSGPDVVDGWKIDITLTVPETRDLCALPLDGTYDLGEDLTPPYCAPVTILLNGVFYEEAESGSTVNVIGGGGGSVTVYNSIDELLATVSAPGTYVVADSTVTAKNSENTTIGSVTVPAENNGNISIADTTVNIYINGSLNQSATIVTLKDETINIYP